MNQENPINSVNPNSDKKIVKKIIIPSIFFPLFSKKMKNKGIFLPFFEKLTLLIVYNLTNKN
jgi:hypothetical protein